MMITKYAKHFAIHGTDKLLHGYHKYYQAVIGDEPVESLLEIGTRDGKSLFAWSEIWPDAKIEGFDLIEPNEKTSEKFKIHIGTSMDSEFTSVALADSYDVIIDDGGHHWKEQLATFYNLYDKTNKYYVIEDIRGGYCLGRIIRELPPEVLKNASVFHSEMDLGKVNFVFTDNIENRTCHFIMIFDKTKNK